MKRFTVFLLFGLFFFTLFRDVVFARIGVGVANGKITVTQKLKPGIIYNLPPFTVVNTGDEESDYEVAITYNEKQPQRKPPESWFLFSPQSFRLKPGKVQVVDVKINLPFTTQPGDYYAYLEAHPVKKEQAGKTSINIAAASKLYFTIVPANIFAAIYYKAVSFWEIYRPLPQIALLVFGVIALFFLAKRFLNIKIQVKDNEPLEKPRSKTRLKQKNDIEKTDE